MTTMTTIKAPTRTWVYCAIQELLGPHQDNQGEVARLAYLYGRLPFAFVESKMRFELMQRKVSKH